MPIPSSRTRWGIISTGHIAGKFAEALQILPEAELYAVANLTFALRTEAANDAYIYGNNGFIHIDEIFAVPERGTLYDKNKQIVEVLEEPVTGNALNYEAEEVMRCLREGLKESPHMPLQRSLEVMRIMDRIREPWGLKYPNDNR